jgi:hypothetical protein
VNIMKTKFLSAAIAGFFGIGYIAAVTVGM